MINSLGLTKKRGEYLETLVDFERAKEQEEKEYFYQKLKNLAKKKRCPYFRLKIISFMRIPSLHHKDLDGSTRFLC